VEGIFRKNGNIKRLKAVSDALDQDPYSLELAEDNQIQLAALIKKYLRDMPEPLIPFKLNKLLLAVPSNTHFLFSSLIRNSKRSSTKGCTTLYLLFITEAKP
jgi:hypothetical protein